MLKVNNCSQDGRGLTSHVSCLLKPLPSAYSAPDSFRPVGPWWSEQLWWLVLNRASRFISIFSPSVQTTAPPHQPCLLFLLQPPTHPHPCVLIRRPWQTLYPCVLVRWGALRLRERFLLFIWGVPQGDALGMTIVESLAPTHTHILKCASAPTHTLFSIAFCTLFID